MKITAKLLACLGLAAAFGTSGCGRKAQTPGPEPQLPTAAVRVQVVEAKKRQASEEVVGTVRPELSASLSAKVSGTVQQMLVAPGQSVKKGELLVQLDAREIQARLDQAVAVRDQTQKDADRLKKLLDEKILTQQEFDAMQSKLLVAQAGVREAETMLSYIRIVAPFDGVITAKRADVGDLAAPGKPLVDMEDPRSLRMEADVPEALMDKIKMGDRLAVKVTASGLSVQAVVNEISPTGDPASRTFRVKLGLPAAPGLRNGLFGRVAVPTAEVSALRVPAAAVVVRGQMEMAFVVVDGKAQMRLVKTGKQLEGEVEIVSGLIPGEQLVVDGAASLRDGQPVQAAPVPPTKSSLIKLTDDVIRLGDDGGTVHQIPP
jgi:membrane fusion protein, multidrug efflux system